MTEEGEKLMSVSLRIFKNGECTNVKHFPGKSIKPVIDLLSEKGVNYRSDKEVEDAYEITRNKDIILLGIDDTNILGVESMANFVSEYLLEYDVSVYKDITSVLSQ